MGPFLFFKVITLQRAELEALLSPVVESLGFEWVGIEWSDQGQRSRLCLYVDKPGGIGLDDLAQVSRQMHSELAVAGVDVGACQLEVSSPGINRILFKLADFERFQGSRVKIELRLPLAGGRRHLTGVIESVTQDMIAVAVDGETFLIKYSQVAKAKLAPMCN